MWLVDGWPKTDSTNAGDAAVGVGAGFAPRTLRVNCCHRELGAWILGTGRILLALRRKTSGYLTVRSELRAADCGLSSVGSDLSSVRSDLNSVRSDLSGVGSDLCSVQSDLSVVRSDLSVVRSDLGAVLHAGFNDAASNQHVKVVRLPFSTWHAK